MSSPTQQASTPSNFSALVLRRSGMKAAHDLCNATSARPMKEQALSIRAQRLMERHGTSPDLPLRVESDPNIRSSDNGDARTTLVQHARPASIPSLDQKFQTLLNLEGGEFPRSSLTSPILPFRQPSSATLCHSGHSRVTVLLEDQEHPTSIPDPEVKAQTLLNLEGLGFLYSNMTSPPIKPLRELSSPNLCPSGHSRATVLLEDQESPTSIPDADRKSKTMLGREGGEFLHSSTKCPMQPVREPSNSSLCSSLPSTWTLSFSSEPLDVVCEDKVQEATMSLSNARQPLRMASVNSMISHSAIPPGIPSSGCSLEITEEDDDIVSEDDEAEHKPHHRDIRIDHPLLSPLPPKQANTNAIESDNDRDDRDGRKINVSDVAALKKHWADLGKRINAMETAPEEPSVGIEGSMADLLKHVEAVESFSDGRDTTTRKVCPTTKRVDKRIPLGPDEAEKSKSRSTTSSKTASVRSRMKNGSRSSRTTSTGSTSSARRSRSVDAGPRVARGSGLRPRSGSTTRLTSKPVSSRKPRCKPRVQKEGTPVLDGSGSSQASHPRTSGSRHSSSSGRRSVTTKDGSGDSSSTSRRQSQNRCSLGDPSIPTVEHTPAGRRTSGRLRARAKLVPLNETKSENDVTKARAQKIKCSRTGQPKNVALQASSSRYPCKQSPVKSSLRRVKSSPNGNRGPSQTSKNLPVLHLGDEAPKQMPAVGDLDSNDTMDGSWWKLRNERHSVSLVASNTESSSIPVLSSKLDRSRGLNGLVF